jgi:hypothetical protein
MVYQMLGRYEACQSAAVLLQDDAAVSTRRPLAARPGEFPTPATGSPATPLPSDLPPTIIERLKAEGVQTCQAWHALGRKRLQIFGITRRHVALIDAAIAAVQP